MGIVGISAAASDLSRVCQQSPSHHAVFLLHEPNMDSDKYQYSPLSEARQIRLLRLHPRANPEDSPLSVDLITVPLDAAPPFEAISYACGDPLPQAKIRCSGLTAELGLSLHSELRRLAPLFPEHERLVWADACVSTRKTTPSGTRRCG